MTNLRETTARMMSNESLREIARFGTDLRTVKPEHRFSILIARSELRERDVEVGLAC